MRKHVFGHMQAAKALIRLRICTVWSGHLLSANRTIGYYRIIQSVESKCLDETLHMNRMTYITKTRLFKYIENFTSKNLNFSDKKL